MHGFSDLIGRRASDTTFTVPDEIMSRVFFLQQAFDNNADNNFAFIRFCTVAFDLCGPALLARGAVRVAARALAMFPRCPVLQPMACKFFATAFEKTTDETARRALVDSIRREGVIAQMQRAAKSGVTRRPTEDVAVVSLTMLGENVSGRVLFGVVLACGKCVVIALRLATSHSPP